MAAQISKYHAHGWKVKMKTDYIQVSVKELDRLRRCEKLLWEVESSLPSGLESWIDYEEERELRGEE